MANRWITATSMTARLPAPVPTRELTRMMWLSALPLAAIRRARKPCPTRPCPTCGRVIPVNRWPVKIVPTQKRWPY